MIELFESVGQQAKGAAVIVGRFNPPTIGHYALFRSVKGWMKKHVNLKLDPMPIVVVIAGEKTSKDKGKNPLSASDRISTMIGSKKADGIKFLTAGSAFDAFEAVRKAGFEPIAVAVGSDRGDGKYIDMLNTYFKAKDGSTIKHYPIELARSETDDSEKDKDQAMDDVLKYVDKDVPTNMVSGSLARQAVKRGEFEKFKTLIGIEDDKAARTVYNKVKRSLDADQAEKDAKAAEKAAKKEKSDGAA